MPRGGDYGGGTLPRRVVLSERAARLLKERSRFGGPRFTTAQASAATNAIIEAAADHRLLYISDDILSATEWLVEAKRICFSPDAQRGIDQLIAALRTAQTATTTE